MPTRISVSDLYQRSQSVLEAASARGAASGDTAIVVDRGGNMRIISSEGWTLTGIIREFGAAEVYMIAKRRDRTTVESWTPSDRCTVTEWIPVAREAAASPSAGLALSRSYAAMSQVTPEFCH
jgi:hypothetical protein